MNCARVSHASEEAGQMVMLFGRAESRMDLLSMHTFKYNLALRATETLTTTQ